MSLEELVTPDAHRGRVIAIIDVGSNSIRLLVARQLSDSAFEVVDEERYDARLGQQLPDGTIPPDGIERGLAAMRIVSQVARAHNPAHIAAAGTEALRRAPNANAFLDLVEAETGLPISILSPGEEAGASYFGVINSSDFTGGHIVDIGGGSLEVMRIEDRQVVSARSVPLGALYATQRYLPDDPPTPKQVRALRKAVHQLIEIEQLQPRLIGVGGAVRNLARIFRARRRYPLRRLHGIDIPMKELSRISTALTSTSSAGRRKIPGMSTNRIDTLPAASVVLHEVARMCGATSLTVSGQGLREGLVWRIIRPANPLLADVRRSSIDGLARANNIDERATEPAASAAAALFDALHPLHGLGEEYRTLLLCAVRLSGIGMHIDFYNRDRHAEYLVHSGDLHGFSHREIVLLGALVRWATSGTPDLSPYAAVVAPDDARAVQQLAVLLGVVHGVYRRSPSPVTGLSVALKSETVRLTLRARAPLDAEVHALESQVRRFAPAFKRELVIRTELPASQSEMVAG